MRPGYPLVITVLLLALAAVLAPGSSAWPAALATVLAVVLFDAVRCWRASDVDVERSVARSLPVNRNARVELTVTNRSARPMHVHVRDETPAGCSRSAFPLVADLEPDGTAVLTYTLVPERRGNMTFGASVVVVRSLLGLWERRLRFRTASEPIRVYPDFAVIREYLTLVAGQQVTRLGVRLTQRRGEGLEFHQLREYRPGDAIRQIDWAATARRRELISREYQEERDQRVVFLIDCGRSMRSRDGVTSHFDQALNAMLLLGYVALRQGDLVGMQSFGATSRAVNALRGTASINVLLNEVYDLHTSAHASDYVSAAERLMETNRKRSMVVLVTSLRESDEGLLDALRLLAQRHVVLLACLRESVLDDQTGREPADFDEALKVAGAYRHLARRDELQAACAPVAQVVIDCVPADLPVRVVNAYWQIKRSGEL